MRLHEYPEAYAIIVDCLMNGVKVTTPTDIPGVVKIQISPKVQQLYDLRAALAREVLARRQQKHEQRRQARAQALASL